MPREMFSQTSLPTEFERRWEQLRDEILTADEGTLQDEDALATLIDRRARLNIPRLRRDATKFSVKDHGTTTQVLADIPYDGYAMCFYYKPSTIYVGQADLDGDWDANSYSNTPKPQTLTLSKYFPTGTQPEAVKSWAKTQVDWIERRLEGLRTEAERLGADLRPRARELAGDRALALTTRRNLAAGLEDGI